MYILKYMKYQKFTMFPRVYFLSVRRIKFLVKSYTPTVFTVNDFGRLEPPLLINGIIERRFV